MASQRLVQIAHDDDVMHVNGPAEQLSVQIGCECGGRGGGGGVVEASRHVHRCDEWTTTAADVENGTNDAAS